MSIAEFEKDAAMLDASKSAHERDASQYLLKMCDSKFNDECEHDVPDVDADGCSDASCDEPHPCHVAGGVDVNKPLQRTKVWKWLIVTYHMLMSILNVGWMYFKVDLSDPVICEKPEDWSSITVSIDQGSDGWSAGHFNTVAS